MKTYKIISTSSQGSLERDINKLAREGYVVDTFCARDYAVLMSKGETLLDAHEERAQQGVKKDPYSTLSMEDIVSWAGPEIVSRGSTYQDNNSVSDLEIVHTDTLIACVLGTRCYATQVTIQGERLASKCTCPFHATCKHAVAVVMEYVRYLKDGIEVPFASQTDFRMEILSNIEEV